MKSNDRRPSAAVVIGLVCIPIFIGALDLTVVSAVLPHVVYDLEIPLQTGLDEAAWVVSGYLIAYTIAMTFMGRLSDLVGRRRVYLLSLVIFAAGSYLVAVADTWPTALALRLHYQVSQTRVDTSYVSLLVLIAARMIQAFGGGAMVPVSMALAGDLYPAAQLPKPLGVIAAVDTAGWVVGHLYGGIITRFLDWRMIFWLNLPVCLIAFLLIWRVLLGVEQNGQKGRMDWLGAILISASLLTLNVALGSGPGANIAFQSTLASGWSRESLVFIILSALFIALFIGQEAHNKDPLVPLRLFRLPAFAPASLANLAVGAGLFIAIANVPLFINTMVAATLSQGAWDSGWMLSALTVPMALASIPGGWLTIRLGTRGPAVIGIFMAICGFLLMSTWQAQTAYVTMIPHLVLTGIGFGLTMAPIASAAVNSAPTAYRGTASALVIIFRLVGMTVGVSSLATYGTQRAEVLSKLWAGPSANLSSAVELGMRVAAQVIHETFLIAAGVSFLAILPLFLLNNSMKGESNVRSVESRTSEIQ